jgi:pimeloyl-ACP methyl ester carboxylesterase
MFTPASLARAAATILAMALALPAAAQAPAQPPSPGGPLSIERQGSFFLGGRDMRADTLSTLPAYAQSGTITVDQVYVRYQIPAGAGRRPPLTFIHGCCLTGKTWETTPDGRMGWDEFFLRKGWPVYVLDQAWRGRSAGNPAAINAVRTGKAPPEELPTVFSAGQEAAWAIFRFGRQHPQVFPGMQFPLEAQAEFWKQMVPDWIGSLPTPNPTVPALTELAQRLDGTVLISHSQSGIYPMQAAELDRRGIAGIVAIEPAACPAGHDDMLRFRGMPVLVLFGDYVDQSLRWAPRLRACASFIRSLNDEGGKGELVVLPDIGIKGNSHMLMQDRNSLEVAEWLAGWLERNLGEKR